MSLKKRNLYLFICSLFALISISCQEKEEIPNILFISIDDLRPELGAYGNKIIQTPHLDQLASEGNIFTNHYTQVPTCGPSRHCLLTGKRPVSPEQLKNDITEKVTSNKIESEHPESFIHHLRRNGYYTVGIGKISHSADGLVYGYNDQPSTKRELPYSWDELVFNSGKWKTGWNSFFAYANGENRQSMKKQVTPYETGNVDDTGYPDGLTAQLAIEKLRELKKATKPFFLGVGFFKPHLPFNAPKKYWDLYARDSIPLSPKPLVPENVNFRSLHNSNEINNYKLTDEIASLQKPVSDTYARKVRHAYYAAVSYVDQQVGYVLNELKALNLDKNTIVVVWGDHGWHLGDQQMWGKHALFENALKSTLIFKVPGAASKDSTITSIVETVDIYPTILALCGISEPKNLDGDSFTNLFQEKAAHNVDNTKNNVAYGYYNRGISVRTNRYRLTKYYRSEQPNIELYDHQTDPFESINIAESHPEIVEKLTPLLEKGNTGLFNPK